MDVRAIAEAAYRCELAANAFTLAGDVAAARRTTAPDMLHIATDAQFMAAEAFLAQFGQDAAGCTELIAGPIVALVVAANAVLLTYPLAVHFAPDAPTAATYEHVSILWLRRHRDWQVAWIHATPLAGPAQRFADMAACGQLVHVACPLDPAAQAAPAPVEESTLAERKWEVINCERAAVQQVIDHDVAGAAAATWEGLISVEVDGSRLDRSDWLAFVGDWKRSMDPPRYGPMQLLTVSPTAMLVTYTLDVQGVYDGQPFTFVEALSSLWVWRAGRWQVAFMQTTLRPPVAPHPLG